MRVKLSETKTEGKETKVAEATSARRASIPLIEPGKVDSNFTGEIQNSTQPCNNEDNPKKEGRINDLNKSEKVRAAASNQ